MFYIGKRFNPQLSQPYFKAYGKLTKKDAKVYSKPSYGTMLLTGYEKEEEYLQAIEEIKSEGYNFV